MVLMPTTRSKSSGDPPTHAVTFCFLANGERAQRMTELRRQRGDAVCDGIRTHRQAADCRDIRGDDLHCQFGDETYSLGVTRRLLRVQEPR